MCERRQYTQAWLTLRRFFLPLPLPLPLLSVPLSPTSDSLRLGEDWRGERLTLSCMRFWSAFEGEAIVAGEDEERPAHTAGLPDRRGVERCSYGVEGMGRSMGWQGWSGRRQAGEMAGEVVFCSAKA